MGWRRLRVLFVEWRWKRGWEGIVHKNTEDGEREEMVGHHHHSRIREKTSVFRTVRRSPTALFYSGPPLFLLQINALSRHLLRRCRKDIIPLFDLLCRLPMEALLLSASSRLFFICKGKGHLIKRGKVIMLRVLFYHGDWRKNENEK